MLSTDFSQGFISTEKWGKKRSKRKKEEAKGERKTFAFFPQPSQHLLQLFI
jgi:hypothetical protein